MRPQGLIVNDQAPLVLWPSWTGPATSPCRRLPADPADRQDQRLVVTGRQGRFFGRDGLAGGILQRQRGSGLKPFGQRGGRCGLRGASNDKGIRHERRPDIRGGGEHRRGTKRDGRTRRNRAASPLARRKSRSERARRRQVDDGRQPAVQEQRRRSDPARQRATGGAALRQRAALLAGVPRGGIQGNHARTAGRADDRGGAGLARSLARGCQGRTRSMPGRRTGPSRPARPIVFRHWHVRASASPVTEKS